MFGYFASNAALNCPDRSFGNDVTITTFPELARTFEANKTKEINNTNIFFIFSPSLFKKEIFFQKKREKYIILFLIKVEKKFVRKILVKSIVFFFL